MKQSSIAQPGGRQSNMLPLDQTFFIYRENYTDFKLKLNVIQGDIAEMSCIQIMNNISNNVQFI